MWLPMPMLRKLSLRRRLLSFVLVVSEGNIREGVPFLFTHNLTSQIMDKNKLQELSKICSPNSILVINSKGIYRLFTPFKATCIIEIGIYSVGQEVTVVAVKMDDNYKIVYCIKNRFFYHRYFVINSQPRVTQSGTK